MVFYSFHFEFDRLITTLHKLFSKDMIDDLFDLFETLASLKPLFDDSAVVAGQPGSILKQLS